MSDSGHQAVLQAIAALNDMRPAWQYTVIEMRNKTPEDIAERLNQLGDQGWELVAISSHAPWFFFKRLVSSGES